MIRLNVASVCSLAAALSRQVKPSPSTGARLGGAVFVAGIVLVAINLRSSIASVGPLTDEIRSDLGLSGATTGLLTTAPLLAFGLVALLAPRLRRRFGGEQVVLWCLATITLGIALRLLGATTMLFLGTILAGCGIAVANVMVPSIIKSRAGDRAPALMGVYAGSLSGGAALATGLTVPVEHLLGGSWHAALGAWAVPAALALALWLPQSRAASAPSADEIAEVPIGLWRDPLAWRVTIFMGLQSMLFYIVVAWLPDILHDQGTSTAAAGLLASIGLFVSIPASPLIAWLAGRVSDQRGVVLLTIGSTTIGLLGLLSGLSALAPLWVILLGFGQGGVFARDSMAAAPASRYPRRCLHSSVG